MSANAIIRGKAYVSPRAFGKLIAQPQRMGGKAARQAARIMADLQFTRWQS
jgi:hypothetical protein